MKKKNVDKGLARCLGCFFAKFTICKMWMNEKRKQSDCILYYCFINLNLNVYFAQE